MKMRKSCQMLDVFLDNQYKHLYRVVMNNDIHCTIKIHELSALEGWYWEITVPGEIHPIERIREFTLDGPGLGIPLVLNPTGSTNSTGLGSHVYKGGTSDKRVANIMKSSFTINYEMFPLS